jgi:leucyl aminopeptidase
VNRSIPKFGTRDTSAPSSKTFYSGLTHLALPITLSEEKKLIALSKKLIKSIEECAAVDLNLEIEKFGVSFTGKVGELVEIPLLAEKKSLTRIFLVGVGESTPTDLRKAGVAVGRKVRGTSAHLFSFLPTSEENALTHLLALGLSTYTWSEKSGPTPDTPQFLIDQKYQEIVSRAEIILAATWKTRDLIHTPANVATPQWIAGEARKLARQNGLSIKVRAGRELAEFGGLRAVGNSSSKNPPHMVEISYSPKSSAKKGAASKHVVLVGKGITFDTGGVSLKRPYDLMIPMKSDMAGSAAVLMTVVAASQLRLPHKVTALMMLAENALSGTAQRPSDVITHYGGTTVEVINTDAEGRLVLADGLAYADKNLNPDYLIDVATLTGAATLSLSRYYAAMYTRDGKIANQLHHIGDFIGDRVWHMPLVDDYSIALESDIADYNHTADKYRFQGGSVTAALFLEKFVGKRRWIHLDIAGTGRSDADSGENPKGGTGFGVRLLTEWLSRL